MSMLVVDWTGRCGSAIKVACEVRRGSAAGRWNRGQKVIVRLHPASPVALSWVWCGMEASDEKTGRIGPIFALGEGS
jgi:hypothetical protein